MGLFKRGKEKKGDPTGGIFSPTSINELLTINDPNSNIERTQKMDRLKDVIKDKLNDLAGALENNRDYVGFSKKIEDCVDRLGNREMIKDEVALSVVIKFLYSACENCITQFDIASYGSVKIMVDTINDYVTTLSSSVKAKPFNDERYCKLLYSKIEYDVQLADATAKLEKIKRQMSEIQKEADEGKISEYEAQQLCESLYAEGKNLKEIVIPEYQAIASEIKDAMTQVGLLVGRGMLQTVKGTTIDVSNDFNSYLADRGEINAMAAAMKKQLANKNLGNNSSVNSNNPATVSGHFNTQEGNNGGMDLGESDKDWRNKMKL